ncbi:MAG: M48 family peptidase, partial [Terracidiphilus sp.]
MTFVRRLPLLLLTGLLLANLVAPSIAAQSAPPAQTPSAAPANPPEAYNLPPDQLAKAIALSRIRNILDIAGSIWGLAVLWLLLATRVSAGIEACAQRISSRRWVQGILFFAAFFVIATLAGLPLDLYGQHVERSYQISVQSWASWFGDQAKGLGLTLVLGTPVLLLFNWIVRRWPRRY